MNIDKKITYIYFHINGHSKLKLKLKEIDRNVYNFNLIIKNISSLYDESYFYWKEQRGRYNYSILTVMC